MTASVNSSDLGFNLEPRLAELIDKYLNQVRGGNAMSVEAYACQHSEHADSLRRLLPALLVLEDLGMRDPESNHADLPVEGNGNTDDIKESPNLQD
jgi:hypothetical protein